jgi:hypothetical protein
LDKKEWLWVPEKYVAITYSLLFRHCANSCSRAGPAKPSSVIFMRLRSAVEVLPLIPSSKTRTTTSLGTLAEVLGYKTQHTVMAVLSASSRLQQQAPNLQGQSWLRRREMLRCDHWPTSSSITHGGIVCNTRFDASRTPNPRA